MYFYHDDASNTKGRFIYVVESAPATNTSYKHIIHQNAAPHVTYN